MSRRTCRAVVAATVTVLAVVAGTASGAVRVVGEKELTPRLTEVTLASDAMERETPVRVLLPEGYDPNTERPYPVLYLLHGCCDDWRSWSDKGAVEELTQGLRLIVVMPDGGKGGFYSDWYNNGAFGPPRWESYHVGELIPWVDGRYRTRPSREGRAIAGLSMGGFGAMSYAARHPDTFVAAAAFSGAVDTNVIPLDGGILDGGPPGAIWGLRPTEEVRWRGHNPWDLALNLRPLTLELRTGNGLPGAGQTTPDPVEMGVHVANVSLHERFDDLGISHVWDDYGPGGHTWPFWQRDLRLTLATFMDVFEEPPARPQRVDFTAVEPVFSAFGWDVRIDRPVVEFAVLRDAGRDGFGLLGSGAATVTTPGVYRPRSEHTITTRFADQRATSVVRADEHGRLTIPVDLGPASAAQQYTLAADLAGDSRRSVSVRIGGASADAAEPLPR